MFLSITLGYDWKWRPMLLVWFVCFYWNILCIAGDTAPGQSSLSSTCPVVHLVIHPLLTGGWRENKQHPLGKETKGPQTPEDLQSLFPLRNMQHSNFIISHKTFPSASCKANTTTQTQQGGVRGCAQPRGRLLQLLSTFNSRCSVYGRVGMAFGEPS